MEAPIVCALGIGDMRAIKAGNRWELSWALRDSASLMTLIHVRIVEFRVMLLLYLEQHLNTYKTSSSGPPSSDEVQAHRPSMLTCPLLSAFRLLPRLFPLPGAHFYTNTQSFGHFSKPYGLSLTILSS